MTKLFIQVKSKGSNLIPVVIQNTSVTENAGIITISWDELVNYSITIYEVWKKVNSSEYVLLEEAATFEITDEDITSGNTYTYKVRGKNSNNEYTGFSNEDSIEIEAEDTTAPSVPTGFTTTNIAETTVDVSWDESTDDVSSLLVYRLYKDGELIDTTAGQSYKFTGLSAVTQYTFEVSAVDENENESNKTSIQVTTIDADPLVQIVNVTDNSARIEWEDFDPDARGYIVLINGVEEPETTNLFLELTNLSSDTTYTVRVRSIDTDGNVVIDSGVSSFTTDEEVVVNPDAPTNLELSAITNTSGTVSWDAVTGADGYNVYVGGVKNNSTLIETLSYNITDLLPGVDYNIKVESVIGENTTQSEPIILTTTGTGSGLTRNFQTTFTPPTGIYAGQEILVDVYCPPNVIADPNQANIPFILFAHGAGESGFDIEVLRSSAGYARFVNLGDDFPYVTISPQARGQVWDIDFGDQVLNHVKSNYISGININKIGVAGWSQGTLPYLYLNEAPERVVVSIPMSVVASVDAENRCESIAHNSSVWPIVSLEDPLGYGGHTAYYSALQSCPNYDPNKHKMTLYSTGGHDCVTRSIRENASGGAVEAGYNTISGSTIHDFIMDAFDFEAPSVPANVVESSKSDNFIQISWDTSTDNEAGVKGYIVNVNGVDQIITTDTSFAMYDLTANTAYTLKVKTIDKNNNESVYSSDLVVTTDTAPSYTLEDTYKATFHGNAEATSDNWTIIPSGNATNASYTMNLNNLDDTKSITFTSQKAWSGGVAQEPNIGDNSGIYIDIVLRTAWRSNDLSSGVKCFKLSGLDPTKKYDFDVLGNTSGEDANNRFILTDNFGDQTIDKNISNQDLTTEGCLAKFTKKTPDANGDIYLDVKILGTYAFAYINAIVTREYSIT